MSNFSQTLDKIAQSACIKISKDDTNLATNIASIVEVLKRLSAVNTDGVEPLLSVGAEIAYLRPDVAVQQEELKSCPHMKHNYFRLLKFVD